MKNLSTFFFDLDGTLIDSSKDIAVAVNYALKQLDMHPLPEEEIIKHVGYGGKKLMEGVLRTDNPLLVEKAVRLFREYYFSNPAVYTRLYPYAGELLEKLKKQGKKIAVITNKYEDISRQILKKLEIEGLIDLLVGGDTTPYKKPLPYPLVYAMEKLGSGAEKTVMIGDSEADIKAGRSAGLKTVFVEFGFGDREKSLEENPDYTISSFKQILDVVDS
ncbi:MAG: HAD-IIIA family hydrolase [Aquificae bacterium]|nr:HAD-IIIA family hydrolase [Aquificota bacterium]